MAAERPKLAGAVQVDVYLILVGQDLQGVAGTAAAD